MAFQSQQLDAGPRAGDGTIMTCLGFQGELHFHSPQNGQYIGRHGIITDGDGQQLQDIATVQSYNQSQQTILTAADCPHSLMVVDTETGTTTEELQMRRRQRNWNLHVDSVTPGQRWGHYRQSNVIALAGLGQGTKAGSPGDTFFVMTHDSRVHANDQAPTSLEFLCSDFHTYKSITFHCQALSRGGMLAMGCSDGFVRLYDRVEPGANASCVVDSMKEHFGIKGGTEPVWNIDMTGDSSCLVWNVGDLILFACVEPQHYISNTGTKVEEKPVVIQLDVPQQDKDTVTEGGWIAAKFDAGSVADNGEEREIVAYYGHLQVRWRLEDVIQTWEAAQPEPPRGRRLDTSLGVASQMQDKVDHHMTVLAAVGDRDVFTIGSNIYDQPLGDV